MRTYEKIETVFNRDVTGTKKLILNSWRDPVVEYLKDNKWLVNEHPHKTRQSEFLKLFPGANVDETNGCLTLNPCNIYEKIRKECAGRKCCECRNEFWLAEVEDGSAH